MENGREVITITKIRDFKLVIISWMNSKRSFIISTSIFKNRRVKRGEASFRQLENGEPVHLKVMDDVEVSEHFVGGFHNGFIDKRVGVLSVIVILVFVVIEQGGRITNKGRGDKRKNCSSFRSSVRKKRSSRVHEQRRHYGTFDDLPY